MSKFIHTINVGDRYGKLVVESAPYSVGEHGHLWHDCKCDCGKTLPIRRSSLIKKSKHATCCGCTYAHLSSRSRLYNIWAGMRKRCNDKNHKTYENYGSRGISVCPEWATFKPFAEWAYANGYAEDLQIDRIDNDGNYEPCNCRWVDNRTNSLNRRNNLMLTCWDETKPMAAWSDDPRCLVGYEALMTRLRLGWSVEESLSTPKMR